MEAGISPLLQAQDLEHGGRSVSRTTGLLRKAVPSTCMLCPARCGILAFVEEGIVIKVEGNPEHPNNRGKLCGKGQAAMNMLYSPDRLLKPLKRMGPRGTGKWKAIPWEEALTLVADKLRTIRHQGRSREFAFMSGLEGQHGLIRRFLNAYGQPAVLSNLAWGQVRKSMALELTWGADLDVNDLAYTKYILNFGSNPYEAHPLFVGLAQRLVEGRLQGAKLVTFDPRLSNTAGKSDEWHPLKPGTDGLVALALAHEIMRQGLYDRQFIERWCNVSLDTLIKHLAPYTPETASKESGIKVQHIKRIAAEFASTKPATTMSGRGVTSHRNGIYNERCVALLNAITGNVDVRGGYCLPRTFALPEPAPAPPSHVQPWSKLPGQSIQSYLRTQNIPREGRNPIKALITYKTNPVYSSPASGMMAKLFQDVERIPFYVAVDCFMTETAAYADIILPDTTFLEAWALETPPAMEMVPLVSLRRPVVPPIKESRPFTDVLVDLAHVIGGMEEYFHFGNTQDYLEATLEPFKELKGAGGINHLMEKGVWVDPRGRPDYKSYQHKGFNTPSRRIEISSSQLKARGFNPLPVYEPIPHHQKGDEDELIMITYKWNVLTERTGNFKWLAEIVHNNPVIINTETARQRGIEHGDKVKISSPLGTIVNEAFVCGGIHPQVIAVSGSLGHWGFGSVAQGRKNKTKDPDTELLWWHRHSNGVDPNPMVPLELDPIGQKQSWMDVLVKVTKA
jgi:anaerobic selenocysteine-containing dehydrogenase